MKCLGCSVAVAMFALVGAANDKTVKASSFGWNAEDSTAALQSAFDSGARKVVIDRQAGDWITRPLFITNSNIEVVLADGVVLKAKRGEYYGKNECLIRITGKATNIVLRGEGKASLKMNKADYLDPKNNYAFSEWRHAVSILSARNVTVKNLTILSSGGDGVYVNGPKGVVLEDLTVLDHNRQGMSPISVTDMIVRRCSFNDTYGAPPQCGIDMEPNKEYNSFVNVIYEDCAFNGNASHGIDLYFGHFTARTKPVSITFRRCKAYGNRNSGLSFMTGNPSFLEKRGQVKGFVRFEDCTFANNGAEVIKIFNHSTNGMNISFADCVFDARGSMAESAMLFSNNRFLGDFGSLTFERCSMKLDAKTKVCAFEAQRGIGIGGKLSGVLDVERGEMRETFDLAKFAAKHPPKPEEVVRFKTTTIDYTALKYVSANPREKGVFTPNLRKPFVYVVAVPAAGEYKIRFKSRKLRKGGTDTLGGVVQLLDRAGTDLGKFDVTLGDFEYTLKANCANVYRFEVSQRNGSVIKMACNGAAGGVLADNPVHLFGGKNKVFHFCVPAEAETVSARINPSEPAEVELIDAKGQVVAKMPFQSKQTIFKVKREKTSADEIWKLRFVNIDEDMSFQLGVDGIPIGTFDSSAFVMRK